MGRGSTAITRLFHVKRPKDECSTWNSDRTSATSNVARQRQSRNSADPTRGSTASIISSGNDSRSDVALGRNTQPTVVTKTANRSAYRRSVIQLIGRDTPDCSRCNAGPKDAHQRARTCKAIKTTLGAKPCGKRRRIEPHSAWGRSIP